MIIYIRKETISPQYLGTQVLGKCPDKSSDDFINGYLYFVEHFFDLLDGASFPYDLDEGIFEADLGIILDQTQFILECKENHTEDFWNGVVLATEHSLQIVKLAYNSEAPYSEAA